MIKIGVFTDLHYSANKFYLDRNCYLGLMKLEIAVEMFNKEKVDYVFSLGDLIDSCKDFEKDTYHLKKVKKVLDTLEAPYHIVLGNHDLECLTKNEYNNILGREKSYYSFVDGSTKFIILDTNFNEKFEDYNKKNYLWNISYICPKEIKWLEKELETDCDKIFIFSHQNLDPRIMDSEFDPHVVRNSNEVREVLEKSNKDIRVIQGHYHTGYHQVHNNIDYLTHTAMVIGDDTKIIPIKIIEI